VNEQCERYEYRYMRAMKNCYSSTRTPALSKIFREVKLSSRGVSYFPVFRDLSGWMAKIKHTTKCHDSGGVPGSPRYIYRIFIIFCVPNFLENTLDRTLWREKKRALMVSGESVWTRRRLGRFWQRGHPDLAWGMRSLLIWPLLVALKECDRIWGRADIAPPLFADRPHTTKLFHRLPPLLPSSFHSPCWRGYARTQFCGPGVGARHSYSCARMVWLCGRVCGWYRYVGGLLHCVR